MIFDPHHTRVYIYSHPIDMRYGFERLSHLVREQMSEDILEGNLFLFLGKNRKRAKVLYFDHTGLILLVKRLEGGKIMSLFDLEEVEEISVEELSFLLSGARLRFSGKRKKKRVS
jgi:transposase